MLSKAISLLILLAVPWPLLAGEQHFFNFGGVDARLDPMLISDSDASSAMNVLTDEGDLRTIYGNTLYDTVGASSITFTHEYINSGGQRILFVKTGTTLYSNDLSTGAFKSIVTFSGERELDAVNAFGKAYFADGTAYPFYSTGSSTAAAAAGMESCKYVEQYQNRLVCVNTSTETSKVCLSKYNDPDTWTTGSSVDDAAIKYFYKGDGEDINCVYATHEGIFIGKASRSGMLKGSDNETFYWTDVSKTVGCVDDRSVQMVDGELVWLSKDGFYAYDFGNTLKPISLDVKPYTDKIRQSNSADSYWLVDTKADWEKGTTTGWDTETSSGSMISKVYNSGALTDNAYSLHPMSNNAGFESATLNGWTFYGTTWDLYSSTIVASTLYRGTSPAGAYAGTWTGGSTDPKMDIEILQADDLSVLVASTTADASAGTVANYKPACFTYYFTGVPTGGPVVVQVRPYGVDTSSATSTAFTPDGTVGLRYCGYCGDSSAKFFMFDLLSNNELTITSTGTVYDSGLAAPTYIIDANGQNSEVAWYSGDTAATISYGGTISLTGTTAPTNKRYFSFGVNYSSNVAVSSFTNISVSVLSTAAYYSEVKYLSDLAEWGAFSVSKTTAGANPIFYVRSATYTYTQTAASPTWTLQNEDAKISAGVYKYYQFMIDPNVPTTTCSVTMAYVNSAYSQGYSAPRVASGVRDHRYVASVSSNSADYNDLTFIWQKNKEWTFTDQTYGAIGEYNHKMVAGSTTTLSKLWYILDETATTFGGNVISSWWTTKDFSLGAINNHKVIDRFWLNAENSGLTALTISWQGNRDTVWNSTTTSLSGSYFIQKEVEGLFETSYPVRQIRFKFSAAEVSKYFRLKLYSVYFRVNELIKD